MKKNRIKEIKDLFVLIIIAFTIKTCLIEIYVVPTGSMEKTILIGDMLFGNKFIYGMKTPTWIGIPYTRYGFDIPWFRFPHFREVKNGDVTIFEFPRDPFQKYVKRCIGIPGDDVEIKEGEILINDVKVEFPIEGQYLKKLPNNSQVLTKEMTWNSSMLYSYFKAEHHQDDNNNLGAIISKQHMKKILDFIELAKSEGGKIITGGKQLILEGELSEGFYIQPTIIEGLSASCRTNQEEIFGPVVSIIPFTTENEVIEMANSTKYGLSASIFTKDVSRAHYVASAIDSGIVWVNTWMLRDLRIPFGGMKNSGIGREGGFKALQFFTEPKNVCIKI